MGSISNNTDFQSELLRINGTLQASITELRYQCEVYRLSLKSITKVLDSVQRDQDGRLRYLATSRPSFQAYLLNLCQKQALDRIKNVVRKASTFINGYSLVDKRLFQPPPPKPSSSRSSSEENKNASATNNAKLTDGSVLGWASKSCTGPGISPVIAKNALVSKEHDGAGAESSKNNKGNVKRKHSSSRRRRERRDKMSGNNSESKCRVRSKKRHKRSSSGSMPIDKKRRAKSDASQTDDRSYKEIKRSQSEKEKVQSKCGNKHCITPVNSGKYKDGKTLDWQSMIEQTRSRSTKTLTRNHHDNNHRHHHEVINFRTLSNHHEEEKEDDHNETGGVIGEPSPSHLQSSILASQVNGVANRIPPLFSIATIKTPGSPHKNLRAEARRVCSPSKEKQYEGRRAGVSTRTDNQKNEREQKAGGKHQKNDFRNQSVFATRLNEIHEAKTTTRTSATRWSNSSTITAKNAGYKVRESLSILRNRNGSNSCQGQGVVARKYLFSSHNLHNNFKLNSTTVSNTNTTFLSSAEKVWRIQISGSPSRRNDSFIGSECLKEENPYGASRKSVCTSNIATTSRSNNVDM